MQSTIPLKLTPESSQIRGYGYDEATKTLAIEFNSNHTKLTYHYPVAPAKFAELDAAESKGSWFYANKKHLAEFERMDKPQEQAAASEGGEAA